MREGLFFHFMCSKWSASFWAFGSGNSSNLSYDELSDLEAKPSKYGVGHVPSQLRQQCHVRGGGRWHEHRWNLTFTADPPAVRYVGEGEIRADTPALPLNKRNVPDEALFTFHDPLWGDRPLRGCEGPTPTAPRYRLPARMY